MDAKDYLNVPYPLPTVTIVQEMPPKPRPPPFIVDVTMKTCDINDTNTFKKKRVDEGTVGLSRSFTTSKLVDASSPMQLSVERPLRATSSSPVGTFADGPFQRNGLRASVGSCSRYRTQSPTDKGKTRNFYKDALLRDSANARTSFLSGAWMVAKTNARAAPQNSKGGNNEPKPAGQGTLKSNAPKRRLTCDAMDTS